LTRRWRRLCVALLLYAAFCAIGGVYLADIALHPGRRPLTDEEGAEARQIVKTADAEMEDVSVTAADGTALRAWMLRPRRDTGNAVIVLHGVSDNRGGMIGYAQLLLAHGLTVLMPDARAHGASDGTVATYGLLERQDIASWYQFLVEHAHPQCIFGFGESMGAAQLLQSLSAGVRFCAIAVESPFANFREIAYDRMGQPFHLGPWFGRTVLRPLVEAAFLRARWKYGLDMQLVSPEDSAAGANAPILLIHGQEDSNIPVRHSREIHARAPATELWEVPGADHCGAISVAPKEFEERLVRWFSLDHTVR